MAQHVRYCAMDNVVYKVTDITVPESVAEMIWSRLLCPHVRLSWALDSWFYFLHHSQFFAVIITFSNDIYSL